MPVFIDYYREAGELHIAGVRDSRGRFTTIRRNEIDRIIAYMIGRELIVTYERPKAPIMKLLVGYEHYIEDENISERWTDLYNILLKETGDKVALSSVARGTLGLGPQSDIVRLKSELTVEDRLDIEPKMEQRLGVLSMLYDYATLHGQLAYEKKGETRWADVNINENP